MAPKLAAALSVVLGAVSISSCSEDTQSSIGDPDVAGGSGTTDGVGGGTVGSAGESSTPGAGGAAGAAGATSIGASSGLGGFAVLGGTAGLGGIAGLGGAMSLGGTSGLGGTTTLGGTAGLGGTTSLGGTAGLGGTVTLGGTAGLGGTTSLGGTAGAAGVCGHFGEPCCGGVGCPFGGVPLQCAGGICVDMEGTGGTENRCGYPGEPCCSGDSCLSSSLQCVDGSCEETAPAAGGSGGVGGGATGGAGGAAGGACVDACELYGSPCCFESGDCIQPGSSCVVNVLSTGVSIVYEYPDLEQAVASLPQDVLVSFTDADIEWAAAEPGPASRIEMHLTAQASSDYGALLESADLHPFRVSCDGEELFLGVFYLIYGAAAINTPVLHVERDVDDLVVLRLGAWQGAWLIPSAGAAEARERIDRTELRTVFCQRGALQELDVASN